jgi:hypothetical protein
VLNVTCAASPPRRSASRCEVDDDRSHHTTCINEKTRPIRKPHLLIGRELEKGLVHQRGGVEQRVTAAAAQARPCELPQFAIRRIEQCVDRWRLAAARLVYG